MIYIALAILAYCVYREIQWAKERRELLQRIQAPERAVRQFAERPQRKAPLPVPIDDDNAHREARERREGLNGNGD